MTPPKLRPYHFAEGGFGWNELVSWTLPGGAPKLRLRAAVTQHEHVFRWRVNYRVRWKSDTAFCDTAGLSASQFGRMCRGESWMQVTDLAALVHTLVEAKLPMGIPTPDRLEAAMVHAEALVDEAAEEAEVEVRKRAGVADAERRDLLQVNILEIMATAAVRDAMAEETRRQEETLAYIKEVVGDALERSAVHLRANWVPEFPPDPIVDLRIETARPGQDSVYAMPDGEGVYGEARLDGEWLAAAERSGRRFQVGGHFILRYAELDEHDRPVRVDALRLLPTAWSPAVPVPNSPEYASCPATIRWAGKVPHLVWDQEDLIEAAATWVARFPPEVMEAAR